MEYIIVAAKINHSEDLQQGDRIFAHTSPEYAITTAHYHTRPHSSYRTPGQHSSCWFLLYGTYEYKTYTIQMADAY